MNAKNVLLSAAALLLLTAFAAAPAAQAQVPPTEGAPYFCQVRINGSVSQGQSGIFRFYWLYQNTPTIKRGIEEYWLNNGTHDNRKVDFFWTGGEWEFTRKDEFQCKDTQVSSNGGIVLFRDCTLPGYSRDCFRSY